jgi:hypothetical protein
MRSIASSPFSTAPFAFQQQHHRLAVHRVVVDDEDPHARQIRRRCGERRLRAQETARQGRDHLGASAAAARPQPAQGKVQQLRQHLGQLRHGAGDHRQIVRHRAMDLDAELAERGLALRQHAVDHHGRVARLGGARRVGGELQEMARDFGGAADFAVQQHQRPRPFRVQRAAVQQIGEGTDRGEAVVQGVEHVRRAFIEDDVLQGGGCRGFGGGWRC